MQSCGEELFDPRPSRNLISPDLIPYVRRIYRKFFAIARYSPTHGHDPRYRDHSQPRRSGARLTFTVSVTDNDTAGLDVSAADLTTDGVDEGSTATYTAALTAGPVSTTTRTSRRTWTETRATGRRRH